MKFFCSTIGYQEFHFALAAYETLKVEAFWENIYFK